jgi:hypothetical protein
MSHRKHNLTKDYDPLAENWVRKDTIKSRLVSAKEKLAEVKARRSKFDEILIPDPTRPRCWICKLIKKV